MADLWHDLTKNKPLLIAVLAGIGIFLYVIYKNGPGSIASPTDSGGHTTYVEGSEVIQGPPGPTGRRGPRGRRGRPGGGSGGLYAYTHKSGTLESAPHVPIFHGGQIVTVPSGARVRITGTEESDSSGKQYWQVVWDNMTGLLGGDVVTP